MKNKHVKIQHEVVKVMGAQGSVITIPGIIRYVNSNIKELGITISKREARNATQFLKNKGLIATAIISTRRNRPNSLKLTYEGEQLYKALTNNEITEEGMPKLSTGVLFTGIISAIKQAFMDLITIDNELVEEESTTNEEIAAYINKHLKENLVVKKDVTANQISGAVSYLKRKGYINTVGKTGNRHMYGLTKKGLKNFRVRKVLRTTYQTKGVSAMVIKAIWTLTNLNGIVPDEVIITNQITTSKRITKYINKHLENTTKLRLVQVSSAYKHLKAAGYITTIGKKGHSSIVKLTEEGLKYYNFLYNAGLPPTAKPVKETPAELEVATEKLKQLVKVFEEPLPAAPVEHAQPEPEQNNDRHDVCDCWLKNPDEEIENDPGQKVLDMTVKVDNFQSHVVIKKHENISTVTVEMEIDTSKITAVDLYKNLQAVNVSVGNTFLKPKHPAKEILGPDQWELIR